jgi:hypothetical protein
MQERLFEEEQEARPSFLKKRSKKLLSIWHNGGYSRRACE